jgi:hypothetical protein
MDAVLLSLASLSNRDMGCIAHRADAGIHSLEDGSGAGLVRFSFFILGGRGDTGLVLSKDNQPACASALREVCREKPEGLYLDSAYIACYPALL